MTKHAVITPELVIANVIVSPDPTDVKRGKILDLYYADKISQDTFADEDGRLTTQIGTLRKGAGQVEVERQEPDELAQLRGSGSAARHGRYRRDLRGRLHA